MENYLIWIRDKHPGSAKLLGHILPGAPCSDFLVCTCMPDVLDPDISAGGKEEPVHRYEEEADHVACQRYAHEEY
jgi:hypothetical protein